MSTTKRGRKIGSGSFVSVSLSELNATLKPNARVIVWGRYAQMLGLDGKKVDAKPDALVAAVAGGKAEVEFDDFTETKKEEFKAGPLFTELVPKVSVELENFE
jgi:hypothetical protein